MPVSESAIQDMTSLVADLLGRPVSDIDADARKAKEFIRNATVVQYDPTGIESRDGILPLRLQTKVKA